MIMIITCRMIEDSPAIAADAAQVDRHSFDLPPDFSSRAAQQCIRKLELEVLHSPAFAAGEVVMRISPRVVSRHAVVSRAGQPSLVHQRRQIAVDRGKTEGRKCGSYTGVDLIGARVSTVRRDVFVNRFALLRSVSCTTLLCHRNSQTPQRRRDIAPTPQRLTTDQYATKE